MSKNIITYDFKAGLPQEFELVDLAVLYENFKDTLTSIHRTGFYHIIWFQQGNPVHWVDFNPIKIKANSLLFLSKDTVQRFDHTIRFSGKAILFTDNFFSLTEEHTRFLHNSPLFNNLLSISQIKLKKKSTQFVSLLQQMTEELQHTKDNAQADILRNLLHNFLLLAERERQEQGFTNIKKGADLDYVMLFKDLLEVSYKKQKKVTYYARQIIVTEKRLNQATSKVLGKSPKELIDNRVLLEAKRILAHTNESVKEIAYHLGFEEPTNFIKYFRKHTTLTPTEFREENKLA